MITQKDIHNILVKADMSYKLELIKLCGFDVEKIKEVERILANICNTSNEVICNPLEYMNTKI